MKPGGYHKWKPKDHIHASHIQVVKIAQSLTTNPYMAEVLKDLERLLKQIEGLRITAKRKP